MTLLALVLTFAAACSPVAVPTAPISPTVTPPATQPAAAAGDLDGLTASFRDTAARINAEQDPAARYATPESYLRASDQVHRWQRGDWA